MKLPSNLKNTDYRTQKMSLKKYIKDLELANQQFTSSYENIKELNKNLKEIEGVQKVFKYDHYVDLQKANAIKESMDLCLELQLIVDFFVNSQIQKDRNENNENIRNIENLCKVIGIYKNEKIEKESIENLDAPLSKKNIDTFMYLNNILIILKGNLNNRIYREKNSLNIAYPEISKTVERIEELIEDYLLLFIFKKMEDFFILFSEDIFLFNNKNGGFLYFISLIECLEERYIEIQESKIEEQIYFSDERYGISFSYTEKYEFFKVDKSPFKLLKKDIPDILKIYEPIFIKKVIIKSTSEILRIKLTKLSFKEILETIKTIQKFKVSKSCKKIYLNEIHFYLENTLVRKIKANEILGLFEFNTEYLKLIENTKRKNFVCIYGRDLITNRKAQLLKKYVENVREKMHEWLHNIYINIEAKFIQREPIESVNSENKIVLTEFISLSSIINEQIEPCSFNTEIIEAVTIVLKEECEIFKTKILKLFHKEIEKKEENIFKIENTKEKSVLEKIFEKNKNNEIRPGFEEYLIGIINSCVSLMQTCNALPQNFEIQLLSEVFNKIINSCIELLSANICGLFFLPYKTLKSLKKPKNILPSFYEDTEMIKKVGPTFKDFFNDYLEVLDSYFFDILFLKSTEMLDLIYAEQLTNFFYFSSPKNIPNKKEMAIEILERDITFLEGIYKTDLRSLLEFYKSKSMEISCLELKRVQRKFKDLKKIILVFTEDLRIFEREGFF